MMPPDLKFRASMIRSSGDIVNEAVNFWGDAPWILDLAYLPENCFGEVGEEVGLRAEYEKGRAQTILDLNDGALALMRNRDALYATAHRYAGTERESTHVITEVPRQYQPEADNPGGDLEYRYGWAREE